jgi:hypothetical protein
MMGNDPRNPNMAPDFNKNLWDLKIDLLGKFFKILNVCNLKT